VTASPRYAPAREDGTKPELTREQAHALYVLREHPVLTASELAHFYNTECFDDSFDDVAETTAVALATRLAALRQRGLARSQRFPPRSVIWEITPEGERAFEDVTNLKEYR
jgi:DNA-binding HxlR family transcriptional regulator